MALVLFDLDGTLIDKPSVERRFIAQLARDGRLRLPQLGAALWFAASRAPRYGRHVWKKNKAYLTGLPVDAVEAWAAEFVQERIARHVRPALRTRLEMHRRANDTLALLTGTPDFLARPIAALLGIEHCCAAVCASREGRFTREPPPVHPFAEAKLELARALCSHLGFSLHQCVAYADSVHDLPLLREVGRAVAVYPEHPLERAARHQGWEILGGLSPCVPASGSPKADAIRRAEDKRTSHGL